MLIEWLDFAVQLRGSWLYLLLLPLAVGISVGIYRITQPTASHRFGVILPALRSAALVMLLLLLLEPALTLLLKRIVPPTIITLLDTSTSMGVGDRLGHASNVLGSEDFARLKSTSVMETWVFADAPSRADFDTLSRIAPAGSATDISAAIRTALSGTVSDGHPSALLLLSDGNHNYGVDPLHTVEELQVPVYAIGFGDATELLRDIQIVDAQIDVPSIAGRPFSVGVELRSWGFDGRRTDVRLLEGETELAVHTIRLEASGQPQSVLLEATANQPGPHIYRIEIAPLEGEVSRRNNQTLLATHVARSEMSVLVVAGAPSPEYSFFTRTIGTDSTFVTYEFVQRGQGAFYDRSETQLLESLTSTPEVIVLLDVGPYMLSGEIGNAIDASVRRGSGLLFVGGKRSFGGLASDSPLDRILPFNAQGSGNMTAEAVALKLAPAAFGHPMMRTEPITVTHAGGSVDPGKEDTWTRLPPVTGFLPGLTLRSGAVELVHGVGPFGTVPVIVSSGPAVSTKAVATLSSQFWRLDLLSSGAGESPHTIRRFWQNALRWLAIELPSGRVRASTDRRVYRGGEPVDFVVQVFDELAKPHIDAIVSIELAGTRLVMKPADPGLYQGSMSGLSAGEHIYTVHAQLSGGNRLGESSGQFVVQEYSLEAEDMRANPMLLQQIAESTGGSFQVLGSWPALLDELNIPTRLQREERAIELWGQDWYILLLISLLCVEWVLRKRQGML